MVRRGSKIQFRPGGAREQRNGSSVCYALGVKGPPRIWIIVLSSILVVATLVIAVAVALAIQTMAAAPSSGH